MDILKEIIQSEFKDEIVARNIASLRFGVIIFTILLIISLILLVIGIKMMMNEKSKMQDVAVGVIILSSISSILFGILAPMCLYNLYMWINSPNAQFLKYLNEIFQRL